MLSEAKIIELIKAIDADEVLGFNLLDGGRGTELSEIADRITENCSKIEEHFSSSHGYILAKLKRDHIWKELGWGNEGGGGSNIFHVCCSCGEKAKYTYVTPANFFCIQPGMWSKHSISCNEYTMQKVLT